MIDVDCYNCGSKENTFYASENGFNLVKCPGCGLLYVSPRPTPEEVTQANKYGVHPGEKTLKVTKNFNRFKINKSIRVLRDFFGAELAHEEKSWLDIGCGYGEFIMALHAVSEDRIKAKGLEPNIIKQEWAQRKGLDVSCFDLNNHATRYDFISLLNVYSHLPNPAAELLNWKHLLKAGGELLLETGDTANLESKDHYRPFNLPDHLSFASEEIVVSILERIGFTITDIKKYPPIPMTPELVAKEIIKIFWPTKTSRIRYLFNGYTTDMYIRAKLMS